MADDDYKPGSMNVDAQQSTYNNVMKFSGYVGLPFSIALGAFFTALLVGSGIFGGIFLFIAVYIFTLLGVKMFFAH